MANKDWDDVVKAAIAQGWRLRPVKKGLMLLAPNMIGKVTVHRTPSDHRALDNIIAKMRTEGGFRWPPPEEED